VRFIVLETPATVTQHQVEQLNNLLAGVAKDGANVNARPLQPVNGRNLLHKLGVPTAGN
jgi:carbonic anhydrase